MKKYIQDILDLRANADFGKTKAVISGGISLRGYNLWFLICSSILASIGLDTNSVAIIIGAMLISPLMSPILGVGLSISIYDRHLLIRSLRNLGVAVLISLACSVLYFIVSPLGEATAEEQARTFPTLLDVMVAFFGGVAGIVSISRHEQTNAIPGVAIATALMPPLCTAGFGIATLQWNYFFGAFYLFFINAVFISLATYLIVKYLHFQQEEAMAYTLEKRYSSWFTVISFVVLSPSIYFLYTVYRNENIKKDINDLVITPVRNQGDEILKWEVQNKDTSVYIALYYSGNPLKDSLRLSIDSTLKRHHMGTYHVKPMRINLTKEEIGEMSVEATRQMFQELHLEDIKKDRDSLEAAKDRLSFDQYMTQTQKVFPFVDTMYNGWLMLPKNSTIDTVPAVFYTSRRRVSKSQEVQLYEFLKLHFSTDTLALLRR